MALLISVDILFGFLSLHALYKLYIDKRNNDCYIRDSIVKRLKKSIDFLSESFEKTKKSSLKARIYSLLLEVNESKHELINIYLDKQKTPNS